MNYMTGQPRPRLWASVAAVLYALWMIGMVTAFVLLVIAAQRHTQTEMAPAIIVTLVLTVAIQPMSSWANTHAVNAERRARKIRRAAKIERKLTPQPRRSR